MNTFIRATLSLILIVAFTGCTAESGDQIEQQQTDSPAPVETSEIFVDTLSIEGMPEPIEMRSYQTPPGFPTPFSTAYPATMVADTRSTSEGEFIRFVSDADATQDRQVLVEYQLYPDTSEFQTVYEFNRTRAESYGELSQRTPHIQGAVTEFTFVSPDQSGYIVFGERESRYYSILVRFPSGYSEGYGPRTEAIFDHWEWLSKDG